MDWVKTNLNIISGLGELPINWLVTVLKWRSARKCRISFVPYLLVPGIVNHISSNKILQSADSKQLSMLPIVSWIELVPPHPLGYFV